jgi:hypothetical protein
LEVSGDRDGKAKAMRVMFLRGETDAGKAARAGTEAMTLLGLPFSSNTSEEKKVVYSTKLQTINAVKPEIVKTTLESFA